MSKVIALLCAILLSAGNTAEAQDAREIELVKEAVLDYIEGIYNMQPERIERSVHSTLAKVGYWPNRNGSGYSELRLTYDGLYKMAGSYNRDGHVADDAAKRVEIYEVMDQTATAKLTAEWGIDYMHLAKIDGKWMIMNILWQGIREE